MNRTAVWKQHVVCWVSSSLDKVAVGHVDVDVIALLASLNTVPEPIWSPPGRPSV